MPLSLTRHSIFNANQDFTGSFALLRMTRRADITNYNNEFSMEETFKTKGTCATTIQFTRDGETIRNIRFTGGCNGNLKAIAKLCEGMKAEDIAAKLLGNTCGGKPTSCADQLARAVLGMQA